LNNNEIFGKVHIIYDKFDLFGNYFIILGKLQSCQLGWDPPLITISAKRKSMPKGSKIWVRFSPDILTDQKMIEI
jgi:hypothetical protein